MILLGTALRVIWQFFAPDIQGGESVATRFGFVPSGDLIAPTLNYVANVMRDAEMVPTWRLLSVALLA